MPDGDGAPLSTPPRRLALALALTSTMFASACASPPAPAHGAPPHHAAWTYTGATGADHWGELDPSFSLCASGATQSPIHLPRAAESMTASAIAPPHWDPVPLSIVNTGHTVQVDDAAPSSLVLDGVTYALVQFHIHTPAEHSIEGRAFDAELHLVHRAPDGKLAVMALLFVKGAENVTLRALFDAIPIDPGAPRSIPGKTIDVAALVPRAPRFLTYDGSLTTPPCSEGVRWLVVVPDPAPLEIAEADLAKLRAAVHAPTNRPEQPRHDRAIELRHVE